MKTKFLLFFMAACLAATVAKAGNVVTLNPTDATKKDSIHLWVQTLGDGDTLLLPSRSYPDGIVMQLGKTIVVKAAPGAVVHCDSMQITPATGVSKSTNCGLVLDGLQVNRKNITAKAYLMNGVFGGISTLTFKNCTFKGVNRCIVRTSDTDLPTLANFSMTGCVVDSCGVGGWAMIRFAHLVTTASFTNNTIRRYMGEDMFLATNTASTNILNFNFTNNTLYKCIKTVSKNYAVCNTGALYGTASNFTFRNNIITQNGTADNAKYPYVLTATGGNLISEKNLIVNFIGTNTKAYNQTTAISSGINDLTLTGLGLSGIGFTDPDNGDFSIIASSPLATASTTGGIVGDPRWLQSVTQPVTVTVGILPDVSNGAVSGAGTFNSGAKVSLTATPTTTYVFKSWKDDSGNVLSTDNPYKFSLTKDTKVNAVFDRTPFVVYWNMTDTTLNKLKSTRQADFYYKSNNVGELNNYEMSGKKTTWAYYSKAYKLWSDTTKTATYMAIKRYTALDSMLQNKPREFRATFSTVGFTGITVQSMLAVDKDVYYKIQKMQYSIDGITYKDLAIIDVSTSPTRAKWIGCNGTLPVEAENQTVVYVRWIADTNSGLINASPSLATSEELYLANVYVGCASVISATPVVRSTNIKMAVANDQLTLLNLPQYAQIQVYAIDGRMLLNHNSNQSTVILPLKERIAIVRISSPAENTTFKVVQ